MKALILLSLIFSGITLSFASSFDGVISSYEIRLSKVKKPTIFIGSSTFGFWSDLENEFKKYHAVNAGLSGSRVDHLLLYKKRFFGKKTPRAIVIYAGENDIVHGDRISDIDLKMRKLINYIRKRYHCPLFILSLKTSPSRIPFRSEIQEFNSRLQSLTYIYKNIYYVDFEYLLYDENWKLGDYFISDRTHLNTKGKKILSSTLKKSLNEHLKK